ncbi:MAG: GNAT family N-acetyltransferase [Caldilinea sp. CFX5]|nr:GNAT family N-acetyltransferase [Caldilinea sp. CFX5]
MLIRPAQVKDAPAMGRVMVDTFLAAHREQMPEEAWQKRKAEWTYDVSAAGWARTITAINKGDQTMCIYIVVTAVDEVVGLAMGQPAEGNAQTGEVVALYVRQQDQGQGIGRQLVQAVAAYLATTGIKSLHIAVLAANTPARRFYEAIGGRVVGERMFDEEGFLLPEIVYGWPDLSVLVPQIDSHQ